MVILFTLLRASSLDNDLVGSVSSRGRDLHRCVGVDGKGVRKVFLPLSLPLEPSSCNDQQDRPNFSCLFEPYTKERYTLLQLEEKHSTIVIQSRPVKMVEGYFTSIVLSFVFGSLFSSEP